ncbi:mitochondrial nucleoid-associated protein 1 [Paralichthys olivaceus]|uniref:mitochondrial nucleoid-associated protein 1 n=1 Tax=Paralichthys olivaceus TaxID=8255 RepID=UPI00375157B0
MSSEVCPFCGKTFKRLKSHLPHCKAADAQTNPTERHVRANQTTGVSEPTAKGKKSRESLSSPRAKKSTTSAPAQTSDGTEALLSSSSPPPSTKKKKQKPTEQIKLASTPSSTTTSLSSSPPLSPPSTALKPKKKSLRALIEAAKTDRAADGSLEGTRSASEGLLSGSTPVLVPDPPSSRTTAPTDAPKKKASKTKRAAQPPSTPKDSDSLDSGLNNQTHVRDDLWVDNVEETKDLNLTILTSGSGDQARITIQDAKALLGRARTSTSSRRRILSETDTTDDLSSKTRLDTRLSAETIPAETGKDVVRCLVTTQTVSEQLLSPSSQQTEVLTAKERSSKSKEAFLIPVEHDGSSQPKLFVPETLPPPGSVGANQGQKVGRHMTELLSLSPSSIQFSNPRLLPLATQTLPARVETSRAADRQILEERKQNTAHNRKEDAVTRRSLGQVRLRELPQWLVCKTPSRPRDAVEMVQRGWQWYYRRYIDVRKGGVGGLGMLLAGYCVLSYVWSYPHIKHDRWRKYH